MTTKLSVRSVHAGTLHQLCAASLTATALLLASACSSFFDVPNTNQSNLEDLLTNPTRAKLSAAATGIFANARAGQGGAGGIQNLVWRLGSMGREGINLSGNNQPDYQEPYFGPLQSTGFGGSQWTDRFSHIRDINNYLDALARVSTAEVSDSEKAAGRAMANTMKALAFTYVILTRDSIGAPVDVGQPISAPPAPFVTKDSVYGYVLGLLDSARADLNRANDFPFPMPPGFTTFATPGTFVQLNRALAAKSEVLRATAAACGNPCYAKAITALQTSFLVADSTQFQRGAFFDFSTGPGDITNSLSEPVNGVTFYAHPSVKAGAQCCQPASTLPDQRLLSKVVAATDTQVLGGIREIPGTDKFTMYFTAGKADPNRQIPIIRDEELVLLDAESQWFAGSKATALADLNLVRQGAGRLAPAALTVASPDSDFVKELMYNRRYSLLWEQGTSWTDARRFNRLGTVPAAPPTGGSVPRVMPVPKAECDKRGLPDNCHPLTP